MSGYEHAKYLGVMQHPCDIRHKYRLYYMPGSVAQNNRNMNITASFEILAAVFLESQVLWDVSPHRLEKSHISMLLHAARSFLCHLQNYQFQWHRYDSYNTITAICVQARAWNFWNECTLPSGMGSRLGNAFLKFHSIAQRHVSLRTNRCNSI
jgi:hypothetical protein